MSVNSGSSEHEKDRFETRQAAFTPLGKVYSLLVLIWIIVLLEYTTPRLLPKTGRLSLT